MKTLYIAIFTLVYSLGAAAQTMRCEGLFSETSQTLPNKLFESKRLSILQMTNDKVTSKLNVEASPFSDNIDQATIEILRMLVQNSDFKLEDKNVLTKNKFTLGTPLKDGYFLESTYESKSNLNPRFVLKDEIYLITPAGKRIRVTKDLLDIHELKIKNSDFILTDLPINGLDIHLRLPLSVEGPLLESFEKMAFYFELFKKSEIAQIVQSDSLTKIKTLFRLRRAKSVFSNVLVKQPFKSALGGLFFLAVINGKSFFPHTIPPEVTLQAPTAITQIIAKDRINNVNFPENDIQLKTELEDLQYRASLLTKTKSVAAVTIKDKKFNVPPLSKPEQNIFIHLQKDEATSEQKTYLVISSDINYKNVSGLQFVSVPVNPKDFSTLINFLKAQIQLPNKLAKTAVN